jgi:hypothetical protein
MARGNTDGGEGTRLDDDTGSSSSCDWEIGLVMEVASGVVQSRFFFAELMALVHENWVFLCALWELDLGPVIIVRTMLSL